MSKFFSWKILEDYFLAIGASIAVAGAVKIFNDALGMLIAGGIFLLTWAIIRGFNKDNK